MKIFNFLDTSTHTFSPKNDNDSVTTKQLFHFLTQTRNFIITHELVVRPIHFHPIEFSSSNFCTALTDLWQTVTNLSFWGSSYILSIISHISLLWNNHIRGQFLNLEFLHNTALRQFPSHANFKNFIYQPKQISPPQDLKVVTSPPHTHTHTYARMQARIHIHTHWINQSINLTISIFLAW